MSSIIPPLVNGSPPPIASNKPDDIDEDEFEPIDFHSSIDIPSPLKNLSLPSTPETDSIKSNNDSNQISKTTTPVIDFQANFDNCPTTDIAIELQSSSENFDDNFSDDFDDFQTATETEVSQTDILSIVEDNHDKTYTQLENLIRLAFGANIEDNQVVNESIKIAPLTLDNDEFFANFDDIEESPSLNFGWKGSYSQKAFMNSLHIKKDVVDKETFSSSLEKPEMKLSQRPLEPQKVDLTQKSVHTTTDQDKSKNSNFSSSLIEDFTFQLPQLTNVGSKINCDKNFDSITTNVINSLDLIEINPTKPISITNTIPTTAIVWPEPGVVDDRAIDEFVNTYCSITNNEINGINDADNDDEWSDFISHTTPVSDSSNVVRWNRNDINNSESTVVNEDDEWGDFISIKSGESMFKQNIRADQNSTQSNYFFLK